MQTIRNNLQVWNNNFDWKERGDEWSADWDGLYQEDAAKKMNISRQTFGNIINSAHKKIADVLLHAKALKIEGGVVKRVV